MVAAKSMAEWPASDRIASEPVEAPMMPLPIVSASEAAIEVRATRSFRLMALIVWFCGGLAIDLV